MDLTNIKLPKFCCIEQLYRCEIIKSDIMTSEKLIFNCKQVIRLIGYTHNNKLNLPEHVKCYPILNIDNLENIDK